MSRFSPKYKPVHVGVSIVGEEAYRDYRLTSKIRVAKKFKDFTTYRRITRKIWNQVAEASVTHESGVYAKDFFYLVPQVMANKPFIELANGKIRSNDHTNGDMYSAVFCNLFKKFNNFCWALEGPFVETYLTKLNKTINKFIPKYYFILPTILKNKL